MADKSVEKYIAQFPLDVQRLLQQIRDIIHEEAVGVEEGISYGMPAYKTYGKPLVYFAAYKKHIGFYATPTGHAEFSDDLSAFKQGKGSVQFPLDKPIPLALIRRIVAFRVKENLLHKSR